MKTDPTYEQAAKSKGQYCEVCGKFVEGFEYQKWDGKDDLPF